MSQNISPSNWFTYTPKHFGHTLPAAEPQPTELFWNQYPNWVNRALPIDNTSIYDRPIKYPDSAAMDPEPLWIGSNTANGRKLPTPRKVPDPKGRDRRFNNSSQRGKVEIYLNGTYVEKVPIGMLCRFSNVAFVTFPRPEATNNSANGEVNDVKSAEGTVKGGSTEWADEDNNAQNLAADLAKLTTNAVAEPKSTTQPGKRRLDLHLDTLWTQPSVEAFDAVFEWMHRAKHTDGNQLPAYGVEDPLSVTLEELVDRYAAALVLNIRPNIIQERQCGRVKKKMTEQRPTLDTLRYVHEHLPIDDETVAHFINQYFYHRFKRGSEYTIEEVAAIEDYVCTVDHGLWTKFKEIGDERDAKRKQYRVQTKQNRVYPAQAKMQSAVGGHGHGDIESGRAMSVDTSSVGSKQDGKAPRGGGKKQQNGYLKGQANGYPKG